LPSASLSATTYTVQAQTVAGSAQAKDTACATMSIDQKGTKLPTTGCW
jgi:Tfp pilus assembly protein PilE